MRRPRDWRSATAALIGLEIESLLAGLVATLALLALTRAPGRPSAGGRPVLVVAAGIVAVCTLVLVVRNLADYGRLSVRASRRFPVPRD